MALFREIMDAVHEKLEGLDLEDRRIILDLVCEALDKERRQLMTLKVRGQRIRVGSKPFRILAFLSQVNEATMRDIKEALDEESSSSIKLALDKLRAKGLVTRTEAPASLRSRYLFSLEPGVKEEIQEWLKQEWLKQEWLKQEV